jgi:multidrug efflux pump subunit AcrB
LRLQSKLAANYDRIPWSVSPPLIKPRYIDDVPVLAMTFWSEEIDRYMLRRVAGEVENAIKREPDVSITSLIGGAQRQVRVLFDPVRLASVGLDLSRAAMMLQAANQEPDAGGYPSLQGQVTVHVGGFIRTVEDLQRVVLGIHGGRPVYVQDVATIADGPAEPDQYVFFGTGPAAEEKHIEALGRFPAITLTVAKRKGTNAITVAENVLHRVQDIRGTILPDNVQMTVTRHYGVTAKEKSNELLYHMAIYTYYFTFVFSLCHSCSLSLLLPNTDQ